MKASLIFYVKSARPKYFYLACKGPIFSLHLMGRTQIIVNPFLIDFWPGEDACHSETCRHARHARPLVGVGGVHRDWSLPSLCCDRCSLQGKSFISNLDLKTLNWDIPLELKQIELFQFMGVASRRSINGAFVLRENAQKYTKWNISATM